MKFYALGVDTLLVAGWATLKELESLLEPFAIQTDSLQIYCIGIGIRMIVNIILLFHPCLFYNVIFTLWLSHIVKL